MVSWRNFYFHGTFPLQIKIKIKVSLDQGLATSVLECRCPAEFSSSPNQTLLNKLIKVFRITRATGRCGFYSGLELNSVGHRHSRTDFPYPCFRSLKCPSDQVIKNDYWKVLGGTKIGSSYGITTKRKPIWKKVRVKDKNSRKLHIKINSLYWHWWFHEES